MLLARLRILLGDLARSGLLTLAAVPDPPQLPLPEPRRDAR